MTPDCKGTYEDAGEYNGKRSYQLVGNGWFIWWDPEGNWAISTERGNVGANFWVLFDPEIAGTYSAGGDAEGDAIVTGI